MLLGFVRITLLAPLASAAAHQFGAVPLGVCSAQARISVDLAAG
jgi:hypothetical protein